MSIQNIKNAFSKGLTFSQFIEKTQKHVDQTDVSQLDDEARFIHEYTSLNIRRMNRVLKTHPVEETLAEKLKSISSKQHWMLITEGWCGDSAQSSPEFHKMSLLNNNIELRIVERDTFPEVMDLYLTNGKKSIPILVVFDDEWNQLYKWGARPAALQTRIDELIAVNTPKDVWMEEIHLWYAKNRGQELYKELNSLIQ
ncbi:MAG: thioredoxin family protein [Ignavibacteriaceae bacterium]|nr:thioredoxin family protein [Ignavibacteriaceae bacterium]